MPEDLSPYCPVALFKKYLSKLNPDLSCLWQWPKDSFDNDINIWYCRGPVGKDTLSRFVTNLSEVNGLSEIYPIHSIHTTGVTVQKMGSLQVRLCQWLVINLWILWPCTMEYQKRKRYKWELPLLQQCIQVYKLTHWYQ